MSVRAKLALLCLPALVAPLFLPLLLREQIFGGSGASHPQEKDFDKISPWKRQIKENHSDHSKDPIISQPGVYRIWRVPLPPTTELQTGSHALNRKSPIGGLRRFGWLHGRLEGLSTFAWHSLGVGSTTFGNRGEISVCFLRASWPWRGGSGEGPELGRYRYIPSKWIYIYICIYRDICTLHSL